jgi:uncharacterized Zn finger protein
MARWNDDQYYYPQSKPIHTEAGLKARSQRGKFGQSWWAAAWITALEQFTDRGRLSRGRSYARSGQVLSLDEQEPAVHARVQGSRPAPYRVSIKLKPLTDAQWEAAIAAMAEEARFAAQLLAGEMPQDIDQAFAAAGVSLFPLHSGELVTDCSCPDPANPCKHIAATHYILGEQLDDDPFLLFRLRGRTEQQILDALNRLRRTALAVGEGAPEYELDEPGPEPASLENEVERFWQPAAPLDGLAVTPALPPVSQPLLRRLGNPAFLPDHDLAQILASTYDAVSQTAMNAAIATHTPPDA